jgi:ASC-1-like (ASCH) protein
MDGCKRYINYGGLQTLMRIEKKVHPEYFGAILEGRKQFELRLADWDIKVGDTLVLREWDPKLECYTGRTLQKQVKYIVKTKDVGFFTPEAIAEHGWQVIGF